MAQIKLARWKFVHQDHHLEPERVHHSASKPEPSGHQRLIDYLKSFESAHQVATSLLN